MPILNYHLSPQLELQNNTIQLNILSEENSLCLDIAIYIFVTLELVSVLEMTKNNKKFKNKLVKASPNMLLQF